jgi:hypothetical protein
LRYFGAELSKTTKKLCSERAINVSLLLEKKNSVHKRAASIPVITSAALFPFSHQPENDIFPHNQYQFLELEKYDLHPINKLYNGESKDQIYIVF